MNLPVQPVRYFATKHLRLLYRSGVASFAVWGVQLLNKQVRVFLPQLTVKGCLTLACRRVDVS
jgi:hypothetical protein